MQNQLPYWVQIIQALGPTIVAVVAACIAGLIALRQWKTAHDKIRLDLFDKRFHIYTAFFSAAHAALVKSPDRLKIYAEFVALKGQSQFLFGRDAADFIEGAIHEIAGFIAHENALAVMKDAADDDRQRVTNLIMSLIEKISERERNAYAVFKKYMSFEMIRGS